MEDHLGSCHVLLDQEGDLVSREEYYPFGETSFGSYGKKRYRFCGKEKDEESGLYYYGARYYMPWVGRFTSVDPLASKFADLSPYNYAGNKPVTKRDLYGLQEEGRNSSPNSSTNSSAPQTDNLTTTGQALEVHNVPYSVNIEDGTLNLQKPSGELSSKVGGVSIENLDINSDNQVTGFRHDNGIQFTYNSDIGTYLPEV